MKFNWGQFDFSGGEVTPKAQGKVDSDLWKTCLAVMANFMPGEQGDCQSRAGFERMQVATDIIGNEGDFNSAGEAVKHFAIQDSPFGNIILELVAGRGASGVPGTVDAVSLRIFDENGNVLAWNPKLYDFNPPDRQLDFGFTPQQPAGNPLRFKTGWKFNTLSTGLSFIDPVDNKICFRGVYENTDTAITVSPIAASGYVGQPVEPFGTDESYTFKFSFSGDPINITIQDPAGTNVFINQTFTDPGMDIEVTFTPRTGSAGSYTYHDFNILIGTFSATEQTASNVWGFNLTKDGMLYGARLDHLDPAWDPSTNLPTSFDANADLNAVQAVSFWVETDSSDGQITISPQNVTKTAGTTADGIYLSAQGGSGQGYVWSMTFPSACYGSVDADTGHYIYTGGALPPADGTFDFVRVTDSLGNIAEINIPVQQCEVVNPSGGTSTPLRPGQTITITPSYADVSPPSPTVFSLNSPSGGSITQTGVYTTGPYNSPIDPISHTVDQDGIYADRGSPHSQPTFYVIKEPTKVKYFFVILGGFGATPLQLVWRTPQDGDTALLAQWTVSQIKVRQSLIDQINIPLPDLGDVVALAAYQSRLILGFDDTFGSIAGSAVGPNVNSKDLSFGFTTTAPVLVASDAFNLKLASPNGRIAWFSVLRGLILGTTRAEKIFSSGPLALDPATGQSFSISDESNIGSDENMPAVNVNDRVAFFMHGRRALRLAGINISSDGGLVAEDPTMLGEHLLYPRVRSFCYLKASKQMVFACDDGTLALATLNSAKQIVSWNRMPLPYGLKAFSVTALDTAKDSQLWVGTTTGQSLRVKNLDSRHVPKLISGNRATTFDIGQAAPLIEYEPYQMPPIMDNWVRYPVTAAGTILGLPPEFIGLPCGVLQNGVHLGTFIPTENGTNGTAEILNSTDAIPNSVTNPIPNWAAATMDPDLDIPDTLLEPAEVIVGLLYPQHRITLLPLEGGNPMGTAQGAKSRKVQAYIRLVDSYLPLVGGKRAYERAGSDSADVQASRVTGDIRVTQLGFDRNSQLTISQDKPLRVQISAVYAGTQVSVL